MFARATQPFVGFLIKDLKRSVLRPRLGVAIALVAAATLALAWYVGDAASDAAASEEDPSTLHLWQRGADGALVTLAFITPLFLPLIPVVIARASLEEDRATGVLPLTLSKRGSTGFVAAGKFAGLMVGLAVPLIPLTLAAAFLIQGMTGETVDTAIVVAFVVATLLLSALFLLLALVFGYLVAPEYIGLIMAPVWLGFNLLRPLGFQLFGQLIGAFRTVEILSYSYAWTDLATFTGLFHGFMATGVPEGLMFVVPAVGADALLPLLVPWTILPWTAGLLVVLAGLLTRVPSR
ncbi:MAG: hypothetical protein ACE5I4_01070 [Thermoplasmata archaeon]